jgi:crotonobetainyl-CoA:carnitine CoA-transferase CaiB-like acyl-CoA transferase
MLDFQAARYLVSGEVAGQAGNNHPTGAPTGVFRTKDGYVNIAPTRGSHRTPELRDAEGSPRPS